MPNHGPNHSAIRRPGRYLAGLLVVLILGLGNGSAWGEFYDRLDAYPPRWSLDTSDCDARLTEQRVLPASGFDGEGCETITFHAGLGSEAVIVYPIEPVHAIDDLNAGVYVLSARPGARVGLRLRFPYVRDPETRRPISAVIYGATYERPGKFQRLGIGKIESDLRICIAKLHRQLGSEANLADPYVDAVAINAYSGAGLTTLRLDELSIEGMVSVGDLEQSQNRSSEQTRTVTRSMANGLFVPSPLQTNRESQSESNELPSAFPKSSIIRIIEHRGEPLAWLRSLGFNAVLLSHPPTAEILREAIRTGMLVYSPPPMAPDPELQTLLDPVMAWYLGGGVALDQERIAQTDQTVTRLRGFPTIWQRPIVIAPVEAMNRYASFADAVVYDAALRSRGLSSDEQVKSYWNSCSRIADRIDIAVSVESSAPIGLSQMNDAIAANSGAPSEGVFRWHSLLIQVFQLLEHSPSAIVFHSPAPLTSGTSNAHQRSLALSYLNGMVAMMSPWMAWGERATPYTVTGSAYHCGVLKSGSTQVLMLTSDAGVRDQILAGDGTTVEINLPPAMAGFTAWRMTDFTAERLPIRTAGGTTRLQVVSPDIAEVIVLSADARLGTQLEQSARQFANRAASDRWQLSGDQARHAQTDWQNAVSSGASEALMPVGLLNAAMDSHARAEDAYRAGDFHNTLRLARRADAWATRANIQLGQSLVPLEAVDDVRYQSIPPLDEGNLALQALWRPLMLDRGWSNNLIALGGLDQPNALGPENWTYGKRNLDRAESDIVWISRGYFSGSGAMRLTAASTTSEPLGGGYAGTIAMLSSPSVRIAPKQVIRIDVMVRTVGFSQPHQGLLVYDSLGGQELGVLVHHADSWKRVRLYRYNTSQQDIRAMFEIIGDGEAIIDEVSIRVWEPGPLAALPEIGRTVPQ
ncbi:hypothetical protein [Rhodopirellula sp. MGV]|uniref:hypothetical protein n=1 Tax=Rhodopirellula sp. MGV TaxID=2023130 RepID=UPI000B9761E4|nr:hypothetical protein [Rhodopirellula sp. MGV]OYP32336.1 hypothetical protein CGZ80_19920 [Rhodopirellula sp. MGV]PNY35881.1 hypothetical protein C2E31_15565 [Rhodopirellula baltica]